MILTQNELCVGYLCHHGSFLYICQIAFNILTVSMKALEQDNFNLNQLQLAALRSLPETEKSLPPFSSLILSINAGSGPLDMFLFLVFPFFFFRCAGHIFPVNND